MKSILIIENQFLQYEILRKGLQNDSIYVIPSERKDYERLISAVKVYLNRSGYSCSYRDECFDYIKKHIQGNDGLVVDLIVMDNKLGGSTVCNTGLDLAFDIWKKINPSVPILFLSRTDYAEEQRFMQISEMKEKNYHFEWLMKGFLGEETMQELFVKKTVLKKVGQMLNQQWEPVPVLNQKYITMVDHILSLRCPPIPSEKEKFEEIRNYLATLSEEIDDCSSFAKELTRVSEENSNRVDDALYQSYQRHKNSLK